MNITPDNSRILTDANGTAGWPLPMNLPSPSVPLPRGKGSTTLPSPPGRRVGDEGRDATTGSWPQFATRTPWRLSPAWIISLSLLLLSLMPLPAYAETVEELEAAHNECLASWRKYYAQYEQMARHTNWCEEVKRRSAEYPPGEGYNKNEYKEYCKTLENLPGKIVSVANACNNLDIRLAAAKNSRQQQQQQQPQQTMLQLRGPGTAYEGQSITFSAELPPSISANLLNRQGAASYSWLMDGRPLPGTNSSVTFAAPAKGAHSISAQFWIIGIGGGMQILSQGGLSFNVAARQSNTSWIAQGVGDCSGRDVGSSSGETPQLSQCGPNSAGQVAVCWDGVSYKNPNRRGAWCTYKVTSGAACRGGGAPGRMYVCGPQR